MVTGLGGGYFSFMLTRMSAYVKPSSVCCIYHFALFAMGALFDLGLLCDSEPATIN